MIDKSLVVQLVKETQERIEAQLQKEKMQRMQAFAKEDQTIDTNGVLAFALSEAKLFTTLFVSDLLMTIAEYDELDKKIAAGQHLEVHKEDSEAQAGPSAETEPQA